jgi:uncharacterized protein YkwD
MNEAAAKPEVSSSLACMVLCACASEGNAPSGPERGSLSPSRPVATDTSTPRAGSPPSETEATLGTTGANKEPPQEAAVPAGMPPLEAASAMPMSSSGSMTEEPPQDSTPAASEVDPGDATPSDEDTLPASDTGAMTAASPGDEMPPPTGGEGTTPGGAGPQELSGCTQPPEGASPTAVQAWTMLNELRLASGAGCINMVPELNAAAQNHCDYLAMNSGDSGCASSHSETPGCDGFTGETVGERSVAAGYPRELAYTEVLLSYGDNPERAIPGWLITPFHRIPMLDPWTTDMGWGGGPGCDIIDFGRGTQVVPDDLIVVFPHAGQTDVPPEFNGLEAPMPPPPAGGFPSSYPITIYAKDMDISDHVLTVDGDDSPLEHLWLDRDAPEITSQVRAYFNTTSLLYGAPFDANTTYRAKLSGTYLGGELDLEWTFTTGDPPGPLGF